MQIVALREKLFPHLSEDCWLLYADGFGGRTQEIRFTVLDRFDPARCPPRQFVPVSVEAWRGKWNRRLRPFLMAAESRNLYQKIAGRSDTRRFGDIATIGIGYVSGANDFFHLRPSEVDRWGIPGTLPSPFGAQRACPAALTIDCWSCGQVDAG